MTDQERLHRVFFYGLYMDPDILSSLGVQTRDSCKATAMDYQLRIGKLATLTRKNGASAIGMVYSLTHQELDTLYDKPGLEAYRAEAILVQSEHGQECVLCCNLLATPSDQERNPEYEEKLKKVFLKLGLEEAQ